MKGFKDVVREFSILESRGIFHPAQAGKSIIHKSKMYDVQETGIIDDWETFKRKKTIVLDTKLTQDPKYYTRLSDGKNDVYLCGARAQTSPGAFPDTQWPTKDKSKTIALKPQTFKGITDKWMKIPEFKARLFKSIEARSDLSLEMKEYLKTSFMYYLNGTKIKHYDSISSNKNAVMNDYSEILGALWFLTIHSAHDGSMYLPGSGSYPLIDSIVRTKSGEVQLSSKRGGLSNTIKGGDINSIIGTLSSKRQTELGHRYKDELAVLDIIQNNTTVVGTIKAFAYMVPSLYHKHKKEIDAIMKDKSFAKLLKTSTEPTLIKDLQAIVHNVRVKADFSSRADVLFFMSKYIEEHSKTMNYAKLANDVLNGYVVYIIAKGIDDNGMITFDKIDSSSSFKGAYLRYKGGRERAADRLGLQLS